MTLLISEISYSTNLGPIKYSTRIRDGRTNQALVESQWLSDINETVASNDLDVFSICCRLESVPLTQFETKKCAQAKYAYVKLA